MSAVDRGMPGQAPVQIRSLEDQFFRRIPENARDVIGLFDVEGRQLFVNKPGHDFLGRREELGDPFQHVHPEDRDRIRAEYAEIVRTGAPRRLEIRALTHEGKTRLMQSEANPVSDASGRVIAILRIARDVTEERRDEGAVKATLQTIFEHAPIGIAITDMDARYLRANPRFLRMLGYTEEELYALTGWDVLPEEDTHANRKLREELFSGKREDYTWERRYLRKDGDVIWTQNTVALIRH